MISQLEQDVRRLSTESGRRVGTLGHRSAQEYLVHRVTELGLGGYVGDTFELPYELRGEKFKNIVARIPGEDDRLAPILLGAHYDTCGDIPGADDNAAAVAILLAVAADLLEQALERTVLLAFFDAEEPPHFLEPSMGSIRFYDGQRLYPIHCAIIMDLVGHDVPTPGLENALFITGMESDPGLDSVVRDSDPAPVIRTIPTLNRYVGDMSDHHVFRENRRPYLLLTCGRWEHYHADTDTPDKLNYEKIVGITRYLSELTEKVSTASLDGPFEGRDTTETELYFLRNHVRPVLTTMGLNLGLETREDIDRLVGFMMATFGL